MKRIAAVLMLFAIGGCSSQQRSNEAKKAAPAPAPVRPKVSPQQAKIQFESYKNAANKFYASRDYERALANYKQAALYSQNAKQENDMALGSLRSAHQLKREEEIAPLTQRLLERLPANDPSRPEVLDPVLDGLSRQDKKMAFFNTLQIEITRGNTQALNRWNGRALELIRAPLAKDEMDQIVNGHFQPDWKEAARVLSAKTETPSPTPLTSAAPEIIHDAPLDSRTIGAVLPLSGRHEGIARKTLRGLELGLGLYGADPSPFKLALTDSEGRPERAQKATERLIRQDGAIAVVGSVLSKNAQAVATTASSFGTPSISLSQKQGITQLGPLVFRNTVTAEMQVKALVKIAMVDLRMTSFAVLYPNDAYGVEMANLFWDEVLARGGKIVGAQTYSPDETDFKISVQKLVGTNNLSARDDEYKTRMRELKQQKKEISDRHASEDVLQPVVDFQAIFIPDSIKALGQISAMLAFSGVRGVQMLGPNLWNTPSLGKRVPQTFNPVTFVDFPTSVEGDAPEFTRLYRQQFNEEPGPFELQGYDTGLLLRTLITEGARDRQSLGRALSEVKTFPGGLGTLVQVPVREFHRPLMAWTLEKGQISPLLLSK